jgi:endonuclease-3
MKNRYNSMTENHKQKAKRTCKIREILKATYPNVKTQLNHKSPFELLVSTILSAQCTDKQVNKVTKPLFKKLKTPYDFAKVPKETLETLIHPTGFFRNKAKHIIQCSKVLIDQYNGTVPDTLDELVKLPGVGRKTANVILGAAFSTPGIVVDTHVGRIAGRLGLTENKNPVKIEFDLMKIIPENNWSDFSLRLVYFGREVCKAIKPACSSCPLLTLCPFPDKTVEKV